MPRSPGALKGIRGITWVCGQGCRRALLVQRRSGRTDARGLDPSVSTRNGAVDVDARPNLWADHGEGGEGRTCLTEVHTELIRPGLDVRVGVEVLDKCRLKRDGKNKHVGNLSG